MKARLMHLTKMDLLNYQYLDKMNNNIGILCYEGEAALRGDPRFQSLSLSSSSSSSSSSSISSHRTGPPPISPTKRKLSGDQGDSDMDDNEHVAKMSRLFAAQLKPNGDYRSSPVAKDRSRSPSERKMVASALGLPNNHLFGHTHHHHHHHHHHMATLASMDQPLALTKNSMVEAARSSAAAMVTMPHTVSTVERQQNRPSVITCAAANNRNCNLSQCPVSHNGCSNLANNYRRINPNTACDPVIEEHFRRSLGKNYKEPEPPATNSVSITGSVDDHFAKALGETWLQIKNKGSPSSSGSSPNASPNSHMVNHNHSPSVVS
ncbi:transcription cofactor vestigial-like protein 4b isoform X2 [Nothobranchius furzeri]|uniref:Transcript variant X2 n=1 Tax=Nothobranchius furzeri TaxID=105023 RepID=A0A9D2XU92_NOTFU|nr:transcription cofactor vestigial-like protein 4b isoform X2 [Nothobranchius furzeri]KAF7208033.1 transcript variant X2 [Nothobranchius furzeri]